MEIFRAIIGLGVFLSIAYLFSENKKGIQWRLVITGVILQILFGLLITQVPWVQGAFQTISRAFVRVLDFSVDGAFFLFGDLAKNSETDQALKHNLGFLFAFQVLPTIVFFSTVSAGLYYLGILQKIVYWIAWIMAKTMKLSGGESLSAAGNIFLGQTEAPLLVRPFIKDMTRSEIMCLMTGGMATIAGGVLAAYVTFLGGSDPVEKAQFASFLLGASIMNAPAGIVLSKILIPELNPDKVNKNLEVSKDKFGTNLLDAITTGASQGVKLAVNIGAMLLAFVAIIALINYVLGNLIGNWFGLNSIVAESTGGVFQNFSLEYLLGQLFRPLAFAMGVDWSDTLAVGSLLGKKTAVNEFIAYLDLSEMKAGGLLSQKSIVISTFALCGFSNFSSIAIQIGGIGGMAPNQKPLLSALGLRALLAATLACLMTATVAGALIFF
jgi:concentrative nucleoside transporter, CNT family